LRYVSNRDHYARIKIGGKVIRDRSFARVWRRQFGQLRSYGWLIC